LIFSEGEDSARGVIAELSAAISGGDGEVVDEPGPRVGGRVELSGPLGPLRLSFRDFQKKAKSYLFFEFKVIPYLKVILLKNIFYFWLSF